MESHNPNDVRERYCGRCHQFHFALEHQEPVHLNAIVADLQKPLMRLMGDGAPFSLQFEQFTQDGVKYWRALIKIGKGVWKTSHNPQVTPTDALRELSEIMVEAREASA